MAKGRSDVGRRCEVYRGDSRNARDNQTIAAKFRQYFAIQVASTYIARNTFKIRSVKVCAKTGIIFYRLVIEGSTSRTVTSLSPGTIMCFSVAKLCLIVKLCIYSNVICVLM